MTAHSPGSAGPSAAGWQRPFAVAWTWFRELPTPVQVIAWVVGFWILPLVWFLQLSVRPLGVVAAVLFALFVTTPVSVALFGGSVDEDAAAERDPATQTSVASPQETASTKSSEQPSPSASPSTSPSSEASTPQSRDESSVAPSSTQESSPQEQEEADEPIEQPEDPVGDLTTTVTKISDGDTLYLADLDERLRLIGIDTPETQHPDVGVECYGPEATDHLTSLVPPGTEVTVEWDVERYASDGRPLGYLYRSDGLFINLRMVDDGFAQTSTFPPNVAHESEFRSAQREARAAGRGLWSGCDDDDPAEDPGDEPDDDSTPQATGSVEIETIEYDGPGWDVEWGDSEHVVLRNTGDAAVDVSGWSVTDSKDQRITLPSGYRIDAGSTLHIYSGPGDDTAAAYFAGLGRAIWNNSGGDTATLRDASGATVDEYTYDS